ncbi:hypothetical protein Cgig2_021735 [Carnegiea gigantea]|uniref:Uncharacterized protein n=1 Tax=Carnegiea gigantea TaxID=171969 RepID=A0A9Q1K1S9_9CARY|nr:hypothetical protein Cgig2_021735 [Carnegiea gigantea]
MTSTADCSLSSSLVSGADVQSLSSPDTPSPACSSANVTVSLPSAFPAPPLPPPSLGSGILVSSVSSFLVPDLSAIYALGAPSSSWPSPISHAAVLSSQPSGPSVTDVGTPPSTPPPPPVLQPPVDFSSWPSTSASLPPIHLTLFTVNVKNFVTVVFITIQDFLSWHTQFVAFLVHDLMHSKQIWESLSHRFNTASLAHAMDLRRTLSNLSKDTKQSMEDYLRHIKDVTDSLASIRTPIPDIELVQLTLNGLDEDYHTLVTTLSYGTNLLTLDDLRSKLIHYEQRLKFLKTKDLLSLQHSALATSVTSSESGKFSYPSRQHGSGGQRNNRRNNNQKGAKESRGCSWFAIAPFCSQEFAYRN